MTPKGAFWRHRDFLRLWTFVALSPIRSIRDLPEPVTALTAGQAEEAGGLIEPTPLVTDPSP